MAKRSEAAPSGSTAPEDPKGKINVLRFVFIGSMAVAAAVCGSIAYAVVRHLENDLAQQTYRSVAASAIKGAQAITSRKVQASSVLTSQHGYAFPNASQWPNVALAGFRETATQLAFISNSTAFLVNVIVRPDQVAEFESFAAQAFRDHGYPETAGQSGFGFGIWARGGSNATNSSDNRIHDTGGGSIYGSNHSILAPVLQVSSAATVVALMYNSFSEELRRRAISSMLDCTAVAATINRTVRPSCGVVSDFVELLTAPGMPAAILYLPIYPVNAATTMVGMVSTSVSWDEVLVNVVPDYVDGLYCVVSNGVRTFTFVISHGVPTLLGEGDLHDRSYHTHGQQVVLNDIETSTTGSTVYTLTVYPSSRMLDKFHTNNPLGISLGFVAVILFSASLFFLYDFFMRHEANQRKIILEVKRRFVRFVSHEIRTPLNTVCLGLELLQAEMKAESSAMNGEDCKIDEDKQKLVGSEPVCQQWIRLTDDILENANNAVGILNDLLNYDKIEQGTFKLDIGTVNMWKLLRSTVSAFRIQAEKRNVALVLSSADAKPDASDESLPSNLSHLNVCGDHIRLQQVIRNLISNALKFSPENTGIIRVTSVYRSDGLPTAAAPRATHKFGITTVVAEQPKCHHPRAGSIVITVQDNGIGMTPEQLNRLFQEGVQFDANKHQGGGGSGLGLHITKGLIEQHGGTIAIDSAGPGLGATVTVELPLYQFPESKPSLTETTVDSPNGALPGTTLDDTKDGDRSDASLHLELPVTVSATTPRRIHHVLVVDDALPNRKMLVRLLERSGHRCLSACNGQEAVDAFIADQVALKADPANHVAIDTILMDYEMPVLNGPEATKVLRSQGCRALILGVTGNVLTEDIVYFKSMGADNVLAKPVQLTLLDDCWEMGR